MTREGKNIILVFRENKRGGFSFFMHQLYNRSVADTALGLGEALYFANMYICTRVHVNTTGSRCWYKYESVYCVKKLKELY